MSFSDAVTADQPSLGNVAAAVVFALIGFYIGASTFAAGPASIVESGLAAAGLAVFGVWTWVAYLEADRVDRMEGER